MPKSADLYIDGYIGQDNGGIFGDTKTFGLANLNEFISTLEKDVDNINIHINSGGGSVDEGFAIHDKLISSPYTINTIGEGMVGSIATVIFLAGDTRKMFKNSKFFIHNPYVEPFGSMESKDAQRLADELKDEEERILKFYVEKTGKNKEEIKPFMDKQTSFTSQEAIDMGFVTEIVGKETQNKKIYKLVALTKNSQTKNETMEKQEQITWFKKIENMIKGLKLQIKNQMTKTSEGVEVWYDGDLAVGTKIWLDESMSQPAPDGVHTVGNMEATVKEGVVTDIKEVVDQAEALKKENEALKTEVESYKLKISEFETSKLENEKKISDIQKEIVALSKVVIGEAPAKGTAQDFSKSSKSGGKYDNIKKNIVNKYGKK